MKKYKQYPWKFKLEWDGIEWWQSEVTLGSDHYFYYFKFDFVNKEQREALRKLKWRQFGLNRFYYDGPHAQFNLYFFVIYWSTPWTKMPEDHWK
jgi:hypothetical protein